jgi:hypothetical protein
MGQTLNEVAATFGVAVVVTNQMTTRFKLDLQQPLQQPLLQPQQQQQHEAQNASFFVPALGEAWAHVASTRLLLDKTDELVEWRDKHMVHDQLAEQRKRAAHGGDAEPGPKRAQLEPRASGFASSAADAAAAATSGQSLPAAPMPPSARVKVAVRTLSITKSASLQQGSAQFIVTRDGVRDRPRASLRGAVP